MEPSSRYIPALRFAALTRIYDPVVALTTRERTFKQRLIEQAHLAPGLRVLDLACGSGTLAVWMKRAQPAIELTAIDGDPAILAQARAKAARLGLPIDFRQGLSTALPFENASFERVTSTLFFHHLQSPDKLKSFSEALRVLAPGGELHVADWGAPSNPAMRAAFMGIRLLDGFANTAAHVAGRLPHMMREAGFDDVRVHGGIDTLFGTMALYSGRKA
ncbi:MAG TPA: methyltransferase domain-containing protein [Nevskiaceae bacterium]|nr:methyltransferase domain-containing protein [Nevskiaceae bacterium]